MNLDTDHQQPLISQKERQSDVSLMVVPFMKYSCQLNQNLIKHLDPTANLEIKKTKKKKYVTLHHRDAVSNHQTNGNSIGQMI